MSDHETAVHSHDLLLIGGGAAALGALCSLIRTGEIEGQSILMLDDNPGRCGRSGAYAQTYDVPVGTLLACLDGLYDTIREDRELGAMIAKMGQRDSRATRPSVEAFLAHLKKLVLNRLRRDGTLLLRAARCDTLRFNQDLWRVDNQPGSTSKRVLMACGASDKKTKILAALLDAGMCPSDLDCVVPSSEALGNDRDSVLQRLAVAKSPIILGQTDAAADAVRRQLSDWSRMDAARKIETYTISAPNIEDTLGAADLVITVLDETPNFPRIIVNGQVAKFGGAANVNGSAQLTDRTGLLLPSLTVTGPGLGSTSDDDVTRDLPRWFSEDGERAACMRMIAPDSAKAA